MKESFSTALPFLGWLGLAIPACYALAALLTSSDQSVRRAVILARLSLVCALAFALTWATTSDGSAHVVSPLLVDVPLMRVRLDVVTSIVLVLVTFIAFVILRFSGAYLEGDPRRAHFVRWLMATLSAVTSLVLSNNLLVIAAAWVGTSLALHRLLTMYPDRTQALVAAHKKFLVSRIADICVAIAIATIGVHVGTLELDVLYAWSSTNVELPPALHVASVFFVLGAALKCAQLPFHGWLTQVMEAPTPVSALLHAGVINLGGFLLIRLAPLLANAEFALTLLVCIGSATAATAALIMSTRVSVKVMLAWSTIAQMGFMLVECGLGAYHIALLHIVAHSLYKAHAFLSSASAVDAYRAQSLVLPAAQFPFGYWLAAGLFGVGGLTASAWVFDVNNMDRHSAVWALSLVTVLAPAPLLVRGAQRGLRGLFAVTLIGVAFTGVCFALHGLASSLLSVPAAGAFTTVRALIVFATFGTLFVIQGALQSMPQGRFARALYPHLFAGLYLDELFTRLTFHVWPPSLPHRSEGFETAPVVNVLEA